MQSEKVSTLNLNTKQCCLLRKILPPADGADFPYLVKQEVDRKREISH